MREMKIQPQGSQDRYGRNVEPQRTCVRQSFTGTADMASFTARQASRYDQSQQHNGTDWWGVPSRGAVQDAIKHGWADGLRRVREKLNVLHIPALPSVRRVKVRAEMGDEVDMQRVWSGQLDRAWGTTKRKQELRRKAPQTVTIFCRVDGASCESADAMFWRGATAAALVDALRKANRSVKVVAFGHTQNANSRGGMELIVDVTVAEAGQQVDMEKLATVLCLAGYYRSEFFRAMCNLPDGQEPHYGLGMLTLGTPKALTAEAGQHSVLVSDEIRDEASAKAFLEKVASQL